MIDVNECRYYLYDDNYSQKENCTMVGSFSEGNPPCTRECRWYVEQKLKLKEQELKELKETIDDFITDNSSLYSDDDKGPSNLDELQECMQSSMNEFYKCKQALDEIEKIADDNLCEDDCDVCPDNCMCDWKGIKDIINKAKDGE